MRSLVCHTPSNQLAKYLPYGGDKKQQLTIYILLYVSLLCLGIRAQENGGDGGGGKGKGKDGLWNSLLTSFRVCLQQSTHPTETTKISYYN